MQNLMAVMGIQNIKMNLKIADQIKKQQKNSVKIKKIGQPLFPPILLPFGIFLK